MLISETSNLQRSARRVHHHTGQGQNLSLTRAAPHLLFRQDIKGLYHSVATFPLLTPFLSLIWDFQIAASQGEWKRGHAHYTRGKNR